MIRLFVPISSDTSPSGTQMITLGHWPDARRLAEQKGRAYWIVTVVLLPLALLYLVLFAAGLWAGRTNPLIILTGIIAATLLLCSGGPDGDSRRRAPLAPLVSVVVAPMPAGRARRGTGHALVNQS